MVTGSTQQFPGFVEQILHAVEPGLPPWVLQWYGRQGSTSLQVLLSILSLQHSRSQLAFLWLELPHPALELRGSFPSQLILLAA